MDNVTGGQAQWIVERLLADRRISQQDVRGYVADMGREIQDIERRLETLRAAAGNSVATSLPQQTTPAANVEKRRPGRPKKAGHPRGIAGTLAVLLRSIPAAEHAAIAAIRADQGIAAAINAARTAVKKAS